MAKALISYFSVSGTTAGQARRIAGGLRSRGVAVDLHAIDRRPGPDPRTYDLFGVGAPAYYYRLPFVVRDYVLGLPHLDGLPTFAFCLWATHRGGVGNELRGLLRTRGGRDYGYQTYQGIGSYLPYMRLGYRFSPDHPSAAESESAGSFGVRLADTLAGDELPRAPKDRATPLLYRVERLSSCRWLVDHVYYRSFHVDAQRCTGCGLCLEACPVGNLEAGDEGVPHWGRYCLLCFACEATCPEEAISSGSRWRLFAPFYRANVARAARDPALGHIRVRFARGRAAELL